MIRINPVEPENFVTIDDLLRRAFQAPCEARLVQDLRDTGDMVVEYGLTHCGRIVSYAAVSWMQAPKGWLCLAPVASDRDACGNGYATALASEVVKIHQGDRTLVVMRDPALYGRCCFDKSRARNFRSPYPVSHMLLAGAGEYAPAVRLEYTRAFDGP